MVCCTADALNQTTPHRGGVADQVSNVGQSTTAAASLVSFTHELQNTEGVLAVTRETARAEDRT